LAAKAGLMDHIMLLKKSGAHIHPDEAVAAQEEQTKGNDECWILARGIEKPQK
jgi:hypothetical protein